MDVVENWMDETARQGTGPDQMDGNHHLAKVRVAGSNPVFRSKCKSRYRCRQVWAPIGAVTFWLNPGRIYLPHTH